MVNQEYYNLGTAPSVIRQLFAYGLEQAAKVGADKVYDYSLGNPSIPAPKEGQRVHQEARGRDGFHQAARLFHGCLSFDTARAAVAKDLAERFGLDVKRQRAVLHLRRRPGADLHHQGPDRGR